MTCPACGAKQKDGATTCSACQADLSLLAGYASLAAGFYDEALRLARMEGGRESALKSLQVALALDPEHAEAYVVLGKLHAQAGDYRQAIANFRRALELAPEGSDTREKALKAAAKAEQLMAERAEGEGRARALEERRVRASRARRWLSAGALLAAAVVAGALGGNSIRPARQASPQDAARAIAHAVRAHPALSGDHLRVQATGGRITVEGRASDSLHRDLVAALAAPLAGRNQVDLSGIQVCAEPAAETVERMLAVLCQEAGGAGATGPLADLAASRVTVIAGDDGRVRLSGPVVTADARQLLERLAGSLVEPDQLDTSALAVAEDYVVHVVQPGECPYTIAREVCGDARRLPAIRAFCQENAEALRDARRVRAGTILRIPKRLLAKPR